MGDVLQPVGGTFDVLCVNSVPLAPYIRERPRKRGRERPRFCAAEKWRFLAIVIRFSVRVSRGGTRAAIGPCGVVVGPPFWGGLHRHQWLLRWILYQWVDVVDARR